MRAIQKQLPASYHLQQSHLNPPTTPQQATSRWSSFGHKAAVQGQLLDEQYSLCCYSELRCDEEKLGYHIEHVEPKSLNPARTFDYANLAASGLNSDDLRTVAEHFGGHAKLSVYNPVLFVSCHQPNCAAYFSFLSDGRIVPRLGLSAADTSKAEYTIKLLNLNSPFLVTRRRQWWDELDVHFQDHISKGWSVPHLAACDLVPTSARLSRFFSLTRQFYGAVAQQVLLAQAPQLA